MPQSATCRTLPRALAARRAPASSCSTHQSSARSQRYSTPRRSGRCGCAASSSRFRPSSSERGSDAEVAGDGPRFALVPFQAERLLVPLVGPDVQLEIVVEVFVVHACIFKAELLRPPCGQRAPGGLAGSVRRRPGAGRAGRGGPGTHLAEYLFRRLGQAVAGELVVKWGPRKESPWRTQ